MHRMDEGNLEIMTSGHYERPLQAALLDTLGASQREVTAEDLETSPPSQGEVIVGRAVLEDAPDGQWIYSSRGLGPDISRLGREFREFWVRADSVWSKQQILRQVSLEELFAIWDYEGKLEAKAWTFASPLLLAKSFGALRMPPLNLGCRVTTTLHQRLWWTLLG